MENNLTFLPLPSQGASDILSQIFGYGGQTKAPRPIPRTPYMYPPCPCDPFSGRTPQTSPLTSLFETVKQTLLYVAEAVQSIGEELGVLRPSRGRALGGLDSFESNSLHPLDQGLGIPFGVPPELQLYQNEGQVKPDAVSKNSVSGMFKELPKLFSKVSSLFGSPTQDSKRTSLSGVADSIISWGKSAWNSLGGYAGSAIKWLGSFF
jgi:hypothetical protein